jgi:hypothetical protein
MVFSPGADGARVVCSTWRRCPGPVANLPEQARENCGGLCARRCGGRRGSLGGPEPEQKHGPALRG